METTYKQNVTNMIEVTQTYELGSTMEDGRTTIDIPIEANVLTKNRSANRHNYACKHRRRDLTAVRNGVKMKTNHVFRTSVGEL